MVRTLLIKIASDPRKSPRAAEAVRIGAGVGAWNKVKVHLALEGNAVFSLDQFADELTNGDLFAQYLPAILTHGGRILVDASNPSLSSIKPTIHFERINSDEIRQFESQVDHTMLF